MLVLVFFVSATFQAAALAEPSSAADKKGVKRGRSEGREAQAGRPPLSDLSPEDREAVKKALQAVWENPEVMQARDEVKRATDTFRQAMKKAVEQEDPRVAALVGKMHNRGSSKGLKGEMGKKRPGSEGRGGRPPIGKMGKGPGPHERGPGAAGSGRGIGPAGFTAFLGDFSEDEKKRLKAAREKAMESEELQKVQEELKDLLKQGENLRKQRVEMFHQTKEKMFKAMIQADPGVKVLLERMENKKHGRKRDSEAGDEKQK